MKNKILVLVILFIGLSLQAQSNLNQYKYVIVPKKFEFLKEANKYQMNDLTKFLFERQGFLTLMEGESYPDDLLKDRCLALNSNVIDDSSLFKTKLSLVLKDCNGGLVYTSSPGETREKDYSKAYQMALRNAFKSLETMDYKYEPVKNNSKQESVVEKAVVAKTVTDVTQENVTLNDEKFIEKKTAEINKNVTTEVVALSILKEKESKTETSNVLYAQAIKNGYQLVDSSPKVVMILLETAKEDTYIIKGENAIVYKEDGFWYISKNDGLKLETELINIKF
jgi:hypothetical protein